MVQSGQKVETADPREIKNWDVLETTIKGGPA
jgi:hypothetical protein